MTKVYNAMQCNTIGTINRGSPAPRWACTHEEEDLQASQFVALCCAVLCWGSERRCSPADLKEEEAKYGY